MLRITTHRRTSRLKRLFSTLIIIGLCLPSAVPKPPEKRTLLERFENSALFNSLSKILVREYSKGLLDDKVYNLTTDYGRNNLTHESSIACIGVILYEFATGDGPSSRYFYQSDAFTQEVMNSPGVYWLLRQYKNQYGSDSVHQFDSNYNLYNYRYQFSPMLVPLRPKTWEFSVDQHLMTWELQNLSQVLLGSFNADVVQVSPNTLRIHLWNKTSKKSLFGGFGRRLQRPLLLGTIQQHVVFDMNISEVNQRSKK